MEEIDIGNNPVPIEFGFRGEWANFTARHPVFVQRMPQPFCFEVKDGELSLDHLHRNLC